MSTVFFLLLSLFFLLFHSLNSCITLTKFLLLLSKDYLAAMAASRNDHFTESITNNRNSRNPMSTDCFLLSRISKLAKSYWKYHMRSKQNHPYHFEQSRPLSSNDYLCFCRLCGSLWSPQHSISSTSRHMILISLTAILLLDDNHCPSHPLRKHCAFTSQTTMTLRFDPVARP